MSAFLCQITPPERPYSCLGSQIYVQPQPHPLTSTFLSTYQSSPVHAPIPLQTYVVKIGHQSKPFRPHDESYSVCYPMTTHGRRSQTHGHGHIEIQVALPFHAQKYPVPWVNKYLLVRMLQVTLHQTAVPSLLSERFRRSVDGRVAQINFFPQVAVLRNPIIDRITRGKLRSIITRQLGLSLLSVVLSRDTMMGDTNGFSWKGPSNVPSSSSLAMYWFNWAEYSMAPLWFLTPGTPESHPPSS